MGSARITRTVQQAARRGGSVREGQGPGLPSRCLFGSARSSPGADHLGAMNERNCDRPTPNRARPGRLSAQHPLDWPARRARPAAGVDCRVASRAQAAARRRAPGAVPHKNLATYLSPGRLRWRRV